MTIGNIKVVNGVSGETILTNPIDQLETVRLQEVSEATIHSLSS